MTKVRRRLMNVSPRTGHVPWLQGQEVLASFLPERILDCADKVSKPHRLSAANIIDSVPDIRNRSCLFRCPSLIISGRWLV